MEKDLRTSDIRHRRDTLLQLVLPMALLVMVITAALVAVTLLPRGAQIAIISDLMLVVLILCPMAVCLLPFTLLMVVAIVGLNRVHHRAARPLLRKVEGHSIQMKERTSVAADRINRAAIDISARLGFLHRWLGTFEDTANEKENGQP
ncbi:MAG TPA: hypothetical protein VKY59_16265 [Spirillospora sp.]|nr:hypothetical protein [Spirillospora sp.]